MGSLAELCIEKCFDKVNLIDMELPDKLHVYHERAVRIDDMKKLLANVNVAKIRSGITELLGYTITSTMSIRRAISDIGDRKYELRSYLRAFDKPEGIIVEFKYRLSYKWVNPNRAISRDIVKEIIISSRKSDNPWRWDIDRETYRYY